MDKKSTSSLEAILKNAKTGSYNQLKKELNPSSLPSLADYLNNYLETHELKRSDVIKNSQLSKDYVHGFFNGHKKNPSRDRVIALSRAMGMNYEETQRTLKLANLGILYPKSLRDFAIGLAINDNLSVTELNDFLYENGHEILDIGL